MKTERSKSYELIPSYSAPSSWWQHVPVAHWLIEYLKPRKVVELGTHYGVSFFSFCEAANIYSPETFLYAIDTWEGDEQAGFYNNEVYDRVLKNQLSNHQSRSRLIRSTFDDASKMFGDKSIDILHIDGLHTYSAVKHDFETWEDKVKEGGTIMFHDWNVRERDFGVWKLWEEIKHCSGYHCLEMPNGHGLGLATKGSEKPSWHIELRKEIKALTAKGCLLEKINIEREEKERLLQEQKNLKMIIIEKEKECDALGEHAKELNKIIEHQNKNILAKLVQKLKRDDKKLD